MPMARDKCVWYRSTTNLKNFLTQFKAWKGPILNPGASIHQNMGIGIWHCDQAKNSPRKRNKRCSHIRNINWMGNGYYDMYAVNQVFGEN
jgi:hypothetical protein